MSAKKTERLMNLIFLLLATRQYLTKAQIRDSIEAYRDATSEQAFDRMFERDKEDLRELGIEVVVGSHDAYFDDEQGYRIVRDSAQLPEITLDPQEAAVVGLATQVWANAGLAADTGAALTKLKAVGVEVETDVLRTAEPRLSTHEPTFDAVWDATRRRTPISFTYARPGQPSATRHLQPWGILSWRDRWYLGGFDLDREGPRLFRVSRVSGDVVAIGAPGSYEVPPGTDMREVAQSLFPPHQDEPAVLRVRAGRAQSLRRAATESTSIDEATDRLVVRYRRVDELAGEIAGYASDVVVESPAELRDAVVTRLRLAAAGALRGEEGIA